MSKIIGRQDKPIDLEQLESFMRLKPTLEDTAAFFKVNGRTIERHIREHFDKTFVEFRNENMVHTRHDLVREAIRQALSGNTAMLIFCLKNLCGWSDKVDVNTEPLQTFKLKYNVEREAKEIVEVEASESSETIETKKVD